MITTIASQQSLLLRRQRVALVGLVGLAVTAMAGILGWSSHHTIVRVFDQAVRLQAAAGQPAPPNPFLLEPNLSLLSNMVVYIPLIGALLALVVGHLILVDDQGKAMGRLLFTRQVTRTQYALGKILASTRFLPVTLAGCGLVSLAALLYLSAFYCLGAIATAKAKIPANGLVIALGIWLLVVLVLPQIGDTLDADNQLPGGLFQALGLNHDGEVAVLTHFTGYERIRTGIEEASLAKHFERFAFAMSDVKERYRPYGLSWLLNETRNDIGWLIAYATALFLGLRRTLTRQQPIPTGGKS